MGAGCKNTPQIQNDKLPLLFVYGCSGAIPGSESTVLELCCLHESKWHEIDARDGGAHLAHTTTRELHVFRRPSIEVPEDFGGGMAEIVLAFPVTAEGEDITESKAALLQFHTFLYGAVESQYFGVSSYISALCGKFSSRLFFLTNIVMFCECCTAHTDGIMRRAGRSAAWDFLLRYMRTWS